jgi:predicted metalloenzyme YecM
MNQTVIQEAPLNYILNTLGPVFIASVLERVENLEINVSGFQIDHICYRAASQQEYTSRKHELEEMGTLLIESIVGGRFISAFKLYEPIVCLDGSMIDVVELPSPKEGSTYPSGLEHCEFVVPSLEEFVYPSVANR